VSTDFVLDTNVVVAALRSNRGASRQLLRAALQRRFQLLLSVPLLLEYEAVLTRPEQLAECRLETAEVVRLLDALAAVSKPVKLIYRWRPGVADPNDEMVLETALNGKADAIVSFNTRNFKLAREIFRCPVILPAAALQRIRSISP
jgi:putative PIN family toxin of toxin-antitoxin system